MPLLKTFNIKKKEKDEVVGSIHFQLLGLGVTLLMAWKLCNFLMFGHLAAPILGIIGIVLVLKGLSKAGGIANEKLGITEKLGTASDKLQGVFSKIDKKLGSLGSKLFSLISSPLDFKTNKRTEEELKQDANHYSSRLVYLIFFGLCITMFLSYSVNIVMETITFGARAYDSAENVLQKSGVLSDEKIKMIKGQMRTQTDTAVKWVDTQLKQAVPDGSITVKALVQNIKDINSEKSDPQKKKTSGLKKHFPNCEDMIRKLMARDFSSVKDSKKIEKCKKELQGKFSNLIKQAMEFKKTKVDTFMKDFSKHISTGTTLLAKKGPVIFSYIGHGFGRLASICTSFFSTVFTFLSFMSSLYFFLRLDRSLTEVIGDYLNPIDSKGEIRQILDDTIESVFVVNAKIFIFHALFIWMSFSIIHFPFTYLSSLLGGFFAMAPVVSPILICIPAVIYVAIQWHWSLAIIFFLFHYKINSISAEIMKSFKGGSMFMGAMGFGLGFSYFGWTGIFLGPTMMVLPTVIVRITQSLYQSADLDKEK